jgi:hypothetical protein
MLGIANPRSVLGERDHLIVRMKVRAGANHVTDGDMCSSISAEVGRRAPC